MLAGLEGNFCTDSNERLSIIRWGSLRGNIAYVWKEALKILGLKTARMCHQEKNKIYTYIVYKFDILCRVFS